MALLKSRKPPAVPSLAMRPWDEKSKPNLAMTPSLWPRGVEKPPVAEIDADSTGFVLNVQSFAPWERFVSSSMGSKPVARGPCDVD